MTWTFLIRDHSVGKVSSCVLEPKSVSLLLRTDLSLVNIRHRLEDAE